MQSGPSRIAEAIAAVFVPPACREEVLGDLHERYRSPVQYGLDALRTIPMVIVSRIRRTADPQVLMMQALGLYVSFLGAAWFDDRTLFSESWGLLRLAIPAAMTMLGLVLEDAWAKRVFRSAPQLARGPVVGLGFVFASQVVLRLGSPDLALPGWIAVYGSALSLLLSSAVRMLFPPAGPQFQGANVPADWLKQSGGSPGNPGTGIRVVQGIAAMVAFVIVGTWVANRAALPRPRIFALMLVLLIAYQAWKRG